MDIKYYYYSKFVSLKNDEASNLVEALKKNINNNANSNLTYCELGSGWGNISVPVISNLIDKHLLKKWYGFEIDNEKIKYFKKFLGFYRAGGSNIGDYDSAVDKLRNNSCSDFEETLKTINSSSEYTDPKYQILLIESNLEKTEEFDKLIKKSLENEIIDVLFIPFIFQHLENWRSIIKKLIPYFNDNLVVVSGELEGDWETCFSPYKVSEYNDWRSFFQKIWKNNTVITTSLRDFKHYNLSVFSTFIENNGFEIESLIDCPLDLIIKTTEIEFLQHIKHKVWSPFIQNFSSHPMPNFQKKDYSKDVKSFKSTHNINIYKLRKK